MWRHKVRNITVNANRISHGQNPGHCSLLMMWRRTQVGDLLQGQSGCYALQSTHLQQQHTSSTRLEVGQWPLRSGQLKCSSTPCAQQPADPGHWHVWCLWVHFWGMGRQKSRREPSLVNLADVPVSPSGCLTEDPWLELRCGRRHCHGGWALDACPPWEVSTTVASSFWGIPSMFWWCHSKPLHWFFGPWVRTLPKPCPSCQKIKSACFCAHSFAVKLSGGGHHVFLWGAIGWIVSLLALQRHSPNSHLLWQGSQGWWDHLSGAAGCVHRQICGCLFELGWGPSGQILGWVCWVSCPSSRVCVLKSLRCPNVQPHAGDWQLCSPAGTHQLVLSFLLTLLFLVSQSLVYPWCALVPGESSCATLARTPLTLWHPRRHLATSSSCW